MTRALKQSLQKFRKADDVLEILGTLGAAIGGERIVEVPNRPPFVYVQLRNNQNELIQAFNDKVSPVYGLPVIVVRQGNRYVIKERDSQRYSDWQSYSPFLPRHGDQHSFNEMGGGGDVVWVYGKQFMPMLVTPSGSLGGPNVILDPYVIQTQTGNWLYAGATGTANIVQHKPTGSTAIMVLVYVNQNDGNPYLIINSGTHFSNILTGTSQIVPYLPSVTNSAWLPAFAVRLVSGTNSIGWDNLYDVRQYYHSIIPTGTTGGTTVDVQDEGVAQGSASTFNFVGAGVTASVAAGLATINIPGGGTSSGVYKNPGSVLFAGADGYPDEDNLRFYWDNTNHIFRIGPPSPSALLTSSTLNNQNVAVSQNTAATYADVTYGTGTNGSPAPTFAGYRMRGTPSAPTVIADNDTLQLLVGAGYDGSNFINSARIRQSAWGDWSAVGAVQGSKTEFEIIPSGTATRIIFASMRDKTFNVSGSVNIPLNEKYKVNNDQHPHDGWNPDFNTWTFVSADAPSYLVSVNANVTGTVGVGMKTQLTHLSTDKNFIVTAVSVTGSTTWLNLYGGTDYTLNVTGAITNPKYSQWRAPFGFPLSPAKWSVELSDTSDRTQSNPVQNTWYQPGSLSSSIPIGVWYVDFSFHMSVVSNAAQTVTTVQATLSTATNSVSDSDFTAHKAWSGAAGTIVDTISAFSRKLLTLSSKTTYNVIIRTTVANIASIGFGGATRPTRVTAVCAYL